MTVREPMSEPRAFVKSPIVASSLNMSRNRVSAVKIKDRRFATISLSEE